MFLENDRQRSQQTCVHTSNTLGSVGVTDKSAKSTSGRVTSVKGGADKNVACTTAVTAEPRHGNSRANDGVCSLIISASDCIKDTRRTRQDNRGVA